MKLKKTWTCTIEEPEYEKSHSWNTRDTDDPGYPTEDEEDNSSKDANEEAKDKKKDKAKNENENIDEVEDPHEVITLDGEEDTTHLPACTREPEPRNKDKI